MERPIIGEQPAEKTNIRPSNYNRLIHLVLVFGFAAAFAIGGSTNVSADKTTFFCQKTGSEPQVVEAGGQGDLTKEGYQCTPVTHQEAFSCTNGDTTTIYYGNPSVPISQGSTCTHIK